MRIYLSSTSLDLKEHRQAVQSCLRKLGHECVAMEDYVADTSPPAEKCVEDVSLSDVYVGLFAWKYGPITEIEYRTAKEHGLPTLIFLVQEDWPWRPSWIAEGEEKVRLQQLRAELMRDRLVDFFTTPDDLAVRLTAAVARLPVPRQRRKTEEVKKPSLAELLEPYLGWILERHSTLELRGLRHHGRLDLPLEKVFVALKGDRTHPFERAQARLALERELEAILDSGEFSIEEIQEARWYLVAGSAVMPSLESRDRPFLLPEETAETLTLGEAYRQSPRLVILGDPGSGKTTLARWLALIMARALKDRREEEVSVPLHQVDPEVPEEDGATFLLGRAKLPVLVRIAEYAEDRLSYKAENKVPRTLTEFLGNQTWLKSVPTWSSGTEGRAGRIDPQELNGLICEYLDRREALIILDGLDEVPASTERDEILGEVHDFVRKWIDVDRVTVSRGEGGQVVGKIFSEGSGSRPGNQLIVTSRIAGYHASPLQIDLPHLTIEAMGDIAVDRFCDVWMQAVHEIERQPGESEETVRARMKAEAAALQREIHSPQRRGIRALASNPLLAGVLATVFHNEEAQLPEQRVRLYQAAVRHLTDVWKRRSHQPAEDGLDEHEVFDLMEPIAAHIHQHVPTGLLPENHLSELATRHLASSRGENPLKPSSKVRRAVKSFLRVLREDVGLLAARGDGVYGFLHLTFQEYLAARHLVHDLGTAGPKLMDKIDDPRWREPLLMALGHASLEWPGSFQDLLRDLLRYEGELHDLIPRSALLITAALPEMPPLPGEIARELAQALLRCYADRVGLARFEDLREVLEKAVGQLRRHGYEKPTEEVLRSALTDARSGEASLAAAAAALIERLEWYSPRLVQALMDALPNDNPEWSFPVDRALRKAVTPAFPEPPPLPESPQADPALEHLRGDLERAGSEKQRQELEQRIRLLEERHRRRVQEFERKKEEYDRLQNAYNAAEFPPHCRIPTVDLPFRRALESDPDLVGRIVQDPDWLRLTLALYGGMQDYQTPKSIREYEEIAAYLQLSDNERTPFVPLYRERWQGKDTIMGMAVYLDQRSHRLQKDWNREPRFSPENIYQDSPLTSLVLEALRQEQKQERRAETLIPKLRQIWNTNGHPRAQAEALIALIALGQEVRSTLREAEADPARREAARAAWHRLSRLADGLGDPVTRGSRHVLKDLGGLAGRLEPLHWSSVVAAVIATALSRGARPIDTLELLQVCPEDQKPYILAEHLAQRIVGFGDDAVYYAAVTADSFASSGLSPAILVAAVTRAAEARHLDWPTFHFGWSVERFPPHSVSFDDIPLAALKNLEDIHPSIWFMRMSIVWHLRPLLQLNPDLLPEVLAVNLRSRGESAGREETTALLHPGLVRHAAPWSEILRLGLEAKNPYHSARALLRLAEHRPRERAALLQAAQKKIPAILDPHERVQVFERLIQISPTPRRAALVDETLKLVPRIKNTEDQVRALGRLACYVPASKSLLKETLTKLERLEDEAAQARTLRVLMPLLSTSPELLARGRALAEGMRHGWCRSLALERHGRQLLPLHAELARSSPDAAHLWAPLVLDALLQDVEQSAQGRKPDALWVELGRNPGPQSLDALTKHALAEGLVLTRTAVQVLDQLLAEAGREPLVESILPLLEREEMDALPVLELWLGHPNAVVSRYAVLCIAEAHGLSERTVPGVLTLLTDEHDLWRHRAARVIHHPSITPDSPTRTVSALGRETIDLLLRESERVRLDMPQVSLTIWWIMHDLLYDDAEVFTQWVRSVEENDPEAPVSCVALSSLEAVTPQVWEVFLDALISKGPAVQIPLVTSLCRLVTRTTKVQQSKTAVERISEQQWAELLTALGRMDTQRLVAPRILAEGPGAMVEAAQRALDQAELSDQEVVNTAERLLTELFSTSFSEILRLPPDAMKTKMKEVAAHLLYSPNAVVSRSVREAAMRLKEKPDLFRVVLRWLIESLRVSVQDARNRFETKRYYLLLTVAAAAELSPATFSNLAPSQELEPLLVLAAQHHNSYPGRVAAISLLGHLRCITEAGVQALQAAVKDVVYVQQSALDAVLRFRRLDGNILPLLFQGLYHPSAMAGYATARLLSALGRSDRTHPEQRRQILRALAEAVRDPRSERVIHFGYVDARVPALPYLNHTYYQAMMQVAGIE